MRARGGQRHIGMILPDFGGGGAQRTLLVLARALIERGCRIDLLPLSMKGHYRTDIPDGAGLYRRRRRHADRKLIRYCRARGIDMRILPAGPLAAFAARRSLRRTFPPMDFTGSEVRNAVAVARYVRDERPHILVAGLTGPNNAAVLAAELAGRRLPVVVSIHGNVARSEDYSRRGRGLARTLMPKADAAVAVSRGAAGEAVGTLGLDPGRVHAICNPIPIAEIQLRAREEVSHSWFRSGEPPVVLTVHRESPQKDLETLVAAFARVRHHMPTRLAILGSLSEEFRAQVLDLAGSLGAAEDIAFLGFDENPFRYMARAALFVLSSRWEGFGNVLVESLACGTPVVSTDAPYGPAEILENGRWGRLTPVGDAEAMAQAILDSLAGDTVPAEALRRRAEEFSAERAVAAYEALFESLIGQSGGSGIDCKGICPP